jgi:hypothetical protein
MRWRGVQPNLRGSTRAIRAIGPRNTCGQVSQKSLKSLKSRDKGGGWFSVSVRSTHTRTGHGRRVVPPASGQPHRWGSPPVSSRWVARGGASVPLASVGTAHAPHLIVYTLKIELGTDVTFHACIGASLCCPKHEDRWSAQRHSLAHATRPTSRHVDSSRSHGVASRSHADLSAGRLGRASFAQRAHSSIRRGTSDNRSRCRKELVRFESNQLGLAPLRQVRSLSSRVQRRRRAVVSINAHGRVDRSVPPCSMHNALFTFGASSRDQTMSGRRRKVQHEMCKRARRG